MVGKVIKEVGVMLVERVKSGSVSVPSVEAKSLDDKGHINNASS